MCGSRSGRSFRRHSPAADVLHLARQRLVGHAVVLDEAGELHPAASSAVTISPRPWFHSCVTVCVNSTSVSTYVPGSSQTSGSAVSKYGYSIASPSRPIVERPEHRVALAHEEAAAGPEQPRHDLPPALDVGQPAERADPREDEVEPPCAEDVDRGVEVGLDELRRRSRSPPRADAPPRARRARSRARSSAPRAARARSCPSRCGTGGARLRGRRRHRGAAGRSARPRSGGPGRHGTARGRTRPRRRAPGHARPSWRGSRFRGRSSRASWQLTL